MNHPTYLIHFNPNHDPKTGRFTFSGYFEGKGLSKKAKDYYEIGNLDRRRVNVSKKKAQKLINTDLAKLNSWRYSLPNVKELLNGEYTETDEEAEARMRSDIEKASKNKEFVSDWKQSVKRCFNARNDSDIDEYDVMDEEISKLQKKYPEYKELIYGFSPHEKFNYSYEQDKYTGLDKFMKLSDKDAIEDILNYDFYYEPETFKISKSTADQLVNAINYELTSYFIDKYGKENVPEEWLKYA